MMAPSAPAGHAEKIKRRVSEPSNEVQYPKMIGGSQKEGYVYLIRLEFKRAFKIGRSIDPSNRTKDFMIDMPLEMTLISAFAADDYFDAESKLQRMCDHQGWHITGEWYDLPSWAVRAISRIERYDHGIFYRGGGEVSETFDLMSSPRK